MKFEKECDKPEDFYYEDQHGFWKKKQPTLDLTGCLPPASVRVCMASRRIFFDDSDSHQNS